MSAEIQTKKLPAKTLKAILSSTNAKSNTNNIKNNSMMQQSLRHQKQIQSQINSIKRNSNRTTYLNPQHNENQKKQLRQTSEKKYVAQNQENYQKSNYAMKAFQNRGNERQYPEFYKKYSKLIFLQTKKKQSMMKWEIERQVQRLKQLQEKRELQQKLIQNKRDSEALHKIYHDRKKQDMRFRHQINLDKFQMIRTSRRQVQKKQQKFINQLEKQSWMEMRFKKQNAKRVESQRKQLELDTRFQYERARSARFKLSQY